VLEYSPCDGLVLVSPPETSVDNYRPKIEHHQYGSVTAAQTALPAISKSRQWQPAIHNRLRRDHTLSP